MSGDVEKWVEDGARAMPHEEWANLHLGQIARYRSDAHACLRAFLAAAETDGAVLVRVPEPPIVGFLHMQAAVNYTLGFNNCRAAVLAGKVTV